MVGQAIRMGTTPVRRVSFAAQSIRPGHQARTYIQLAIPKNLPLPNWPCGTTKWRPCAKKPSAQYQGMCNSFTFPYSKTSITRLLTPWLNRLTPKSKHSGIRQEASGTSLSSSIDSPIFMLKQDRPTNFWLDPLLNCCSQVPKVRKQFINLFIRRYTQAVFKNRGLFTWFRQ